MSRAVALALAFSVMLLSGQICAAAEKDEDSGREIALESPNSPDANEEARQTAYNGVENRLFSEGREGEPLIAINYPVFNNEAVDKKIRAYVDDAVREYKEEIKLDAEEERPGSYDRWELSGAYAIERANPRVATVIFNLYSYSGGAHGMLAINCLNFDLERGRELGFNDLFGDPEKALAIFSEEAPPRLRKELGEEADEEMIASGTAPELANFENLILLPDGVVAQFQPYQVGPWSAGPQAIKFSLGELAAAKPNPEVWAGEGEMEKN